MSLAVGSGLGVVGDVVDVVGVVDIADFTRFSSARRFLSAYHFCESFEIACSVPVFFLINVQLPSPYCETHCSN